MTTYTLRPISASVSYITTGRAKVGSVVRQADGAFVARLGDRTETRPTARTAFDAVVLPKLGVASRGELAAKNAVVRAKKAEFKREVWATLDANYAGDMGPLLDLIGRLK